MLGGNAEHGLKCALQVKPTLTKFCAEGRQGERLVEMLLDEPADCLDQLLTRISGQRLGSAAQAFTESGTLGLARMRKEADILGFGASRRALWSSGHARG